MPVSRTLRDITGMGYTPAAVSNSALILIDCQNTYREGVMQLEGVEPALVECQTLLTRYRDAGRPVIHIQHDAGAGTPYDIRDRIGAIADVVAPREGEPVVVKAYPSSFEKTTLDELLKGYGVEEITLGGFMTHVCVIRQHAQRLITVIVRQSSGMPRRHVRFLIPRVEPFRPRICTRPAWRPSTIFLPSSCRRQIKFPTDSRITSYKQKAPRYAGLSLSK